MRELGEVTEADMVLAFMRAEIDSARFSGLYDQALAQVGKTRSQLIDEANLSDPEANYIRAAILGRIRGFGRNALLFTGFPPDVEWKRMEVGLADYDRLFYANHETWLALSQGSRRVLDGSRNFGAVPTDANVHISAVAELVRRGQRFPELIAVEDSSNRLVLMEGHTRATAYALAGVPYPVEVMVGSSPQMDSWAFI